MLCERIFSTHLDDALILRVVCYLIERAVSISSLIVCREELNMYGPILLLEDEPFIAIDVEDLLHRAGWADVATFSSCNDANEWLKANTPVLAIVDPQLRDGYCTDIAHTLSDRSVPFILYSGNSFADLHVDFKAGMLLLKPAEPEKLSAAITWLTDLSPSLVRPSQSTSDPATL
jgi:DNA-binding response OmpR family regulator